MPEPPQRVILKPPDAPTERVARLADALREAISVQNRLAAKSPYILRFVDALEERPEAFVVAHEPATPLEPATLFDRQAAPIGPDVLVRAARALAEALAAAHSPAAAGRPFVHGGLCPGVVLTDPDGLYKVTDFGFAPAICKALGVDSYLNLAVGVPSPQTASRYGGMCTAVWEVLSPDVMDRDDRLCAFIDPEKYGSEALTSFEPGSDIIAAGLILYLLAERRHAYLFAEPEAHRVVDMARAMGWGVPYAITRKDLREAADAGVRAWCELVPRMLARLPAERPSAAELVQKLGAAAPPTDLDEVMAQRWLAQLETLLEQKAWNDLAVLIEERPAIKTWPAPLLARAKATETRVREALAEAGRQATIQRELQTAATWFNRLQAAVRAEEWDTAQELIEARPQVDHWPEGVREAVEPLAARVTQAVAERKARAWLKVLQKAYAGRNWSGVDKLLSQRPTLTAWPADLEHDVATIEAGYRQYLEEQERQRRIVQEQQARVAAWLSEVRTAAQSGQVETALELLSRPPDAEHWPPGARLEATQLAQSCRQRLGESIEDRLAAIERDIEQLAQALADEVLDENFARLIRRGRVAARTELVVWHAETSGADGHGRIEVVLRSAAGEILGEPIRGELDFRLENDVVVLCGRQAEFSAAVAEGLAERLAKLQRSELNAFADRLRRGFFPQALVRARLDRFQPQVTAHVLPRGEAAEEQSLEVELRWDDETLKWHPADSQGWVSELMTLLRTTARDLAWRELLAASPLLKTYRDRLALELGEPPAIAADLPKPVPLGARLLLNLPDAAPTPLHVGQLLCTSIDQVAFDANVPQVEAKLRELVVRLQDRSRDALRERVEQCVKDSGARAKLNAPKRSRTPVDEIVFDIRPKGGRQLVLKAAWNVAALTFELPAGWEKTVREALVPTPPPTATAAAAAPTPTPSPPAPAPPKPTPVATVTTKPAPKTSTAPAAPAQKQSPEPTRAPQQAPARGTRRGLILAAALASVAVVVGLGALGVLRSGRTPPRETGTPPVEPPHAVEESTPPVTEPPHTSPPAEPPVVTPPTAEAQPSPPTEQPSETPEPAPPMVDIAERLRDYVASRADVFGARAPVDTMLRALVPSEEWQRAGSSAAPQSVFLAGVTVSAAIGGDFLAVGADAASLELQLELKEGAKQVRQAFVLRLRDGAWEPISENTRALTKLAKAARQATLAVVQNARAEMEAKLRTGDLVGIHAAANAVRELRGLLADDTDVKQLEALLAAVPPTWEQARGELRGYAAAGETDARTGYPARLKDAEGRTLRLVAVSPGDEPWQKLGTAPARMQAAMGSGGGATDQHPWRLYYVDEQELGVANSLAQAQETAERAGRTLPTVSEWVLAVLTLRTELPVDLTGGRREWCVDANDPSAAWVCGGVTQKLRGQERIVPPLPADAANLDAVWRWVCHPLVVQRRAATFGDELTAVRTVLRVR